MKPKLQAQRKFAQGAFVPPAPPIERRAAAEPAQDNGPTSVEVNFISNTRASKILDSIAFSHPGMHIHQPRVVLQRLDSSLQTAVKKSHKDSSKKQSNERRNPAKSSRVLRSMRLSSDDDRPLTYHIQLKPKRKPSTVPKRILRKVAKDKLFNRSTTPSLMKEIPSDKLFNRSTTPSLMKEIPSDKLFNRTTTPSLSKEIPSDKLFNRSTTPSLMKEIPSDKLFNRTTTPSLSKEIASDKLFNRSTTPSLSKEIPSELSSDEDFGPLHYSDWTVDSNSNSPTQPPTSKLFTNEDITNTPSTSRIIEKNLGVITKAPIYYPTEEEFTDPLTFYEKIKPEASKFGVCKVVPPANFKPVCNLSGLERVVAGGQYTARFLNRRGEGTRDLCAIRSYLSTHNVCFSRPPLVDGLELNLPKMYRTVQKYGGFSKVTQKKKWNKVAENMNLSKLKNPERKLDQIYVKYLLPYDILTNEERNTIINKVEDRWQDAQRGLEKRARNPLHMRKVYYCESDESSDEGDLSEDERNLRKIILDEEECVKRGRLMTLATFRKVNNSAVKMYFPSGDATVDATEEVYWETVKEAVDHVCVYTASVDTSDVGYGFTTDPTDPISQHAWNLKNVRKNDGNILRSLGAVVSTTVPILHFGMFFTTNCWHRDPHGLPWIEFLHNGKAKIWYGIPDTESEVFRRAVEKLCPTAVQNKPIWLPSDICMIPPSLLLAEGVTLTRITQEPGEYIFIFPKAYSSSICTGFSISESVYFAVQPWPQTLPQVFKELRDSCEPMMFAPEQLLIAIAQDERVPLSLLRQIYSHLVSVVNEELISRVALFQQGIPKMFVGRQGDGRPWNVSEQAECDVCRRPLFLSKVKVRLYHKALKKMCPQDAQQIREKLATITPPRPISLTLEIFVSDEELQNVLSTGQSRLT